MTVGEYIEQAYGRAWAAILPARRYALVAKAWAGPMDEDAARRAADMPFRDIHPFLKIRLEAVLENEEVNL